MDSRFPTPISADLFRAARSLLGLEPAALARQAAVSEDALLGLERDGGGAPEVAGAVRSALERNGIRFMADGLYRVSTASNPRAPVEQQVARMAAIAEHFQALPVLDPRAPDEMIADMYDENGIPK